jgi:hypothetical protein
MENVEKRSDGHKGFYLFILVVIAIFAIAKYVISDRPERNTSEVKIPPAELNTLQVKAKIAAVLDMAEKMNMKEACQLLSKVSKREVSPSFYDSYPSKREFLDVVELYLNDYIKQGSSNKDIKLPIEFWMDMYSDMAIKHAQPLICATNIFVAIWITTSYPDVSKLKLLKTESNKETWYFPLPSNFLKAYFIVKTKGASWLSGEHYIGDSPQFIKVKPKE